MVPIVEHLRKSGFKVRVRHFRRMNPMGINPRGGKTVVNVTTPDGRDLEGVAICSRKENFSKRLGARIAIGRALASADIPAV